MNVYMGVQDGKMSEIWEPLLLFTQVFSGNGLGVDLFAQIIKEITA